MTYSMRGIDWTRLFMAIATWELLFKKHFLIYYVFSNEDNAPNSNNWILGPFALWKLVTWFLFEKEPKMKFFVFGAFQIKMLLPSNDNILLQMFFGAFHITSRIPYFCAQNTCTPRKPSPRDICTKRAWNPWDCVFVNGRIYFQIVRFTQKLFFDFRILFFSFLLVLWHLMFSFLTLNKGFRFTSLTA